MHAPLSTTEPQPAWDIARLFPNQGFWQESDYFGVADTNRLVELVDGWIAVLEMPKIPHQRIVLYLRDLLKTFVAGRSGSKAGEVLVAPTYMRLRRGDIREPDVLYLTAGRVGVDGVCEGADLVMEVVSESAESHDRDWNQKREDYARSGIPEYWIVDPQLKRVVVLKLAASGVYELHAEAGEIGRVRSALLPGFEVDSAAVWAAATNPS